MSIKSLGNAIPIQSLPKEISCCISFLSEYNSLYEEYKTSGIDLELTDDIFKNVAKEFKCDDFRKIDAKSMVDSYISLKDRFPKNISGERYRYIEEVLGNFERLKLKVQELKLTDIQKEDILMIIDCLPYLSKDNSILDFGYISITEGFYELARINCNHDCNIYAYIDLLKVKAGIKISNQHIITGRKWFSFGMITTFLSGIILYRLIHKLKLK
ncbi:MAG: hypothetical protein Sylvanvirus3_32 [Sylvanvirus sp.]|uniref:Uncharacterized protein n=1 Tax=Sylvanvirus sp. TaxID=2487774 RepID=A0A3G5AHG2_9VIRU|nr:MAG: hypothetical protein Sylvanvirus3_32 [Sylvanvirus sp.]